jgi:DNA polymerase-3 subunit delta
LGLLDQELAKLATYVGASASITAIDVESLVGRSRTAETFKIFEAIGQGQPARAIHLLQQLLAEGQDPMALLGAFSWQLRRVALAWRRHQQGVRLADALAEADFQTWQIPNAEALMRHLGRRRLNRLLDWLLETDLGMKGNSLVPPARQIERLLLKLIAGGASTARSATR